MTTAQETWRDIDGFNGYQASSLGRIRSINRKVQTKSGIRSYKGKILSPCKDAKGYIEVRLGQYGIQRVHRLVALAFVDNPNFYPQVNHIDGDKSNNKPSNLEWCTNSMNQIHARIHGLNKSNKLKQADVIDIRSRSNESFSSLAREYKCDVATISKIAKCISYQWVKEG